MQQPGKPDISKTVDAWAEIVLNIWRNKIIELKLWDTGSLEYSLRYQLFMNAGGDVDKIEFAYNFYGNFLDRGTVNMKPKEWKGGKLFYAQVMRLKEILGEKYANIAVTEITVNMQLQKK